MGCLLALLVAGGAANSTSGQPEEADADWLEELVGRQEEQQQQAVAAYKQPSSWLASALRQFFDDIDWQQIEAAREQIEKFIHKVNRLVGSVRSMVAKAGVGESRAPADARWWAGAGHAPSPDLAGAKAMLDRVACFVGYVRLMNLSNEALAELDAAKAVSSLFGAGPKRNASLWSWLG